MNYTRELLRVVAKSIDAEDIARNVIERISIYLRPDEVFDELELDKWAKENGYIKKEE